MRTNGSDWANPVPQELIEKERQGHYRNAGEARPFGLTKREHFAAMAMQGILATLQGSTAISKEISETISQESVTMADALIKALNNEH